MSSSVHLSSRDRSQPTIMAKPRCHQRQDQALRASMHDLLERNIRHAPGPEFMSFIPADALKAILRPQLIHEELKMIGKDKLFLHISKHARKVFTIMIHARILTRLDDLVNEDLHDDDLPLNFSTSDFVCGQIRLSERGPKYFWAFTSWHPSERQSFQRSQMLLYASQYFQDTLHFKVDDKSPGLFEFTGKEIASLFSKVYCVNVNPLYLNSGSPSSVSFFLLCV